MGKTKKNNKKGGGIGKSKPEKPHTPPEKTRKNVNFSPTTKPPSSPKQNKTKKMFISRNRERQKAVTRYENQQQQLDLMDMVLGKKPLEGGKKKRTRRRKKGGVDYRPPINRPIGPFSDRLEDLINLSSNSNMERVGANNILQDKYKEIMNEIPEANEESLEEANEEIMIMLTPNREGLIPVDFYDEALKPKLMAIKKKICQRINCNDQTGGKKKRKNRKKRTRRRKKGGNEEECPICMEQLDENEKITTKCNHDFHRECFIRNCLTELDKGDFEQRDRENKVFQCPNCRGDTKADCLNDPEVRAIYEEKMAEMAEIEEEEEGIDEFNELVHQIETNLQETIRTIYGSMSDDIPDEIDIFLDGLNYDLNNYYRVVSLQVNHQVSQLSDDDINYISEELETLLDNAEIEYDLNPTMIHEFKKKINEQLQDVDFVPYGGKKKKESEVSSKPWWSFW